MKIRQKLLFGFIGTSLIVGVTACISLIKITEIKYDSEQVNQSSIKEVVYSTEMNLALEAIQTSAQELLVEKSGAMLNPNYTTETEEGKETIKKLQDKFENNLSYGKKATKTEIQLAKTTTSTQEKQESQEETNQLKILGQLQVEFIIHKKIIAQYIYTVNAYPLKAEEFLDDILEPHFRTKLLPLILEYKIHAEAELAREALEIEKTIASTKRIIIISTLTTLLVAISLGLLISAHILNPIIKLKEAAVEISKGKIDTRVNINRSDEMGILANDFNQMLDNLSTITVSKSYIDKIINSMFDTLVVLNFQGIITKVNQATLKLLGYEESELIGKSFEEIFVEKRCCNLLRIEEVIKKCFIGNVETTYLKKDGSKVPVSFSGSLMHNDNGEIEGIVCVAQDITERQRVEEALRESEERYALATRGANDGLWDWNLKTNEIYFSSRWKLMLGCVENDIGNNVEEWFGRVHPEDIKQLHAVIGSHLEGLTPHFENEHRVLHKDGQYRWMLSRGFAVRDADNLSYRIAGSQTDITHSKQTQSQLLHDALHDGLTGLPNRVLFMERLSQALLRTKRPDDYSFVVLFLDLDRFKVVNDSLGHMLGDQLLIAIARRLETCLRPGDTTARLGGDEFTILLENIKDVEDATEIAERIQQELRLPFNLDGHEVFATASIGIALSTTGYEQPEDLLRDADIAMYRAKGLGKARSEVFDKTMHTQAMAVLQLETDLRQALNRREFCLHYQPIVELSSGRITGFEALLRWQHPERGLVSPIEFIPVAEETGLIIPIGYWVLEEACRQMRAWQVQFPTQASLTISVNFSAKQFVQPDIIKQITQILHSTGLDTHSLGLEITESAIMENAEQAVTLVWQLQCLGVKLSLDDFGTGYSSLSYLYRFPFNTLKIDRSFIRRMGVNGENSEIVQTILTLAHSMGMNVTAEGVETAAQLTQLNAIKCKQGQGYFFSKPVDWKAAGALIALQAD